MELAGRRIWVVGASSGIGAALAEELCRRGAQVAVSARRADALKEVAGEWMTAVPCDITDRESVRDAAAEVTAALGGIDIAVLSAGYWKQMDEFDVESFHRQLKVNLGGMANCLGELTVCPGFVETETTSSNTFPMPFMVKAPEAARAIADGMAKQSARIVFPWQMSLLMKFAKLVPDRLWAIALTPRS